MKKLMIAAAAAAMIGGAYAEIAYDYTANLKTTTGKAGTAKAKYSFNLGWDGIDTFWYQDESVIALRIADTNGVYFTTKTVGGTKVPALTSKAKKDGTWLYFTLRVQDLAQVYNQQSDGKWCESLTYTVNVGDCYRVAKSIKQQTIVRVSDCCTDEYVDDDGNYTIGFDLNNRFGYFQKAKATKVEVCGYVNGYCDGATADSYTLAGQGTWSDKLYKDVLGDYVAGIKSISGNIVGVLDAPTCEYCCANPDPSVAFECDSDTLDATLPTAAYGTWTLKFNKKESN